MNCDNENAVKDILQAYIEPYLNTVKLSERQKEAVENLLKFSDIKYKKLLGDVINEINRRQGKEYNKNIVKNNKLIRIAEDKFVNLIIDVLLVFNYRQSENKSKSLENFLVNLENQVEKLKQESETSKFLQKIEKMDFSRVFYEYNRFVEKTTSVDCNIIKTIDNIIATNNIFNETILMYFVESPYMFINLFDKSSIKYLNKYKYHRDNIIKLIKYNKNTNNDDDSNTNCSFNDSSTYNEVDESSKYQNENTKYQKGSKYQNENTKYQKGSKYQNENTKYQNEKSKYQNDKDNFSSTNFIIDESITQFDNNTIEKKHNTLNNMIKKEILAIIKLYISKSCVIEQNVQSFENELTLLLNILDSMKRDLDGSHTVNLQKTLRDLIDLIDTIIYKLNKNKNVENESINRLLEKKDFFKKINNLPRKQYIIEEIIEFAKDIFLIFET